MKRVDIRITELRKYIWDLIDKEKAYALELEASIDAYELSIATPEMWERTGPEDHLAANKFMQIQTELKKSKKFLKALNAFHV